VGWAIGLERLVLLLSQAQGAMAESPPPDLYVISRGADAERLALFLCRKFRQEGLVVERDASGAAFGKQFKRADKSGTPWALVVGEAEAAERVMVLKNLRDPQCQDRRLPIGTELQKLMGSD
jgi:histidyl-tRNA synthetase